MAHITADRVRDTSTSTSTGNFTVSGTAPMGFRTLSAVLSAADTFYYAIQSQTLNEWEVGVGTYSSTNVFARTTVLSSSNAGSAVNFSAGTKDVFLTLTAARTVQSDASGSVGTVQFAAGTVSAPGITTVGDTNTGIFFPAADTIAFAEGGTEGFRLNSSGQIVTTAGTASLPAITTTGDTNTGIFFPAADTIAFSEGGAEAARLTSSGGLVVGTTTDPGVGKIADVIGEVRSVPVNSQTGAYTAASSDAGKFISITTGGVTIATTTGFSVGQSVSIYNNSGSNQTITQGASVTMRQVGTANTGNRTLAQYGLCTILCVASNTYVITGGGIS